MEQMKNITLCERDVYDLLDMLQSYTAGKTDEINQVLADKEAGKRLMLFDDYVDFLAALEYMQNSAKKLMKDIQRQTGLRNIYEEAIDRL